MNEYKFVTRKDGKIIDTYETRQSENDELLATNSKEYQEYMKNLEFLKLENIRNSKLQELSTLYDYQKDKTIIKTGTVLTKSGMSLSRIKDIINSKIKVNIFPAELINDFGDVVVLPSLLFCQNIIAFLESKQCALLVEEYWLQNYKKHSSKILELYNAKNVDELRTYKITINDFIITLPV